MVSLSPPLCVQLLRPRCCWCEVSSTSGHCSLSRLVNIGFSTSQADVLFISKSCYQSSLSCFCSVVANSLLSSTRCDEKCDLQHQWKNITFLHFWSSSFLFFSQYASNSQSDQIASQIYPNTFNVAIWFFRVYSKIVRQLLILFILSP